MLYASGRGVPKDDQQAVIWYRKAADQGFAEAQLYLGKHYDSGHGVAKDERQAVTWYRKAAEQGDAGAQGMLAGMFWLGRGVPRDRQMGYFWSLLASAQGDEEVARLRDNFEKVIAPEQQLAAQAAARDWKPTTAAQPSTPPGTGTDGGSAFKTAAQPDSTGSGFRVALGAIVTNHHAINGCSRVSVNGVVAQLRGSDARSDLALLYSTVPGPSTNLRARRISVGEPVAVAGYPLRGLLSGFNMTTGTLSSLSGIGGDTRLIQITAPVQPGNSGGPVLDSAGGGGVQARCRQNCQDHR